MPTSVLGGLTVILYGMIAVLGAKIWAENNVDFGKNYNMMPVAIGLIIGAADFKLPITADLELGGIALGTIGVIVSYHLMHGLGRLVGNN